MKTFFVSDLDGTLITRNERLSEYSLAVLNGLIEKGLSFTYATARSLFSAERAVCGLKHTLPVIVYNGALIIEPATGRVLHSLAFTETEKIALVGELERFGVSPVVHARENGEDKIFWREGRESAGQARYLSRRDSDPRLNPVHSDGELCRGDSYFFACNGDYADMKRIHDELERTTSFYCRIYPEAYREDYWLEILPRGATKAEAVVRLKELAGFERVVCFGDSANDSEMFDVCDEKYAVENAGEWLKGKATGIVGYCEEDGVAKWLEENAFREP